MKPYSILVCGTNYGRSYIQAALLKPDTYIVKGILARGSERSLNVAREYGLPLYRNLGEVPDSSDIACIVVGSSTPELMLGLLDRGVHILAEHPQKAETLRCALDKADRKGLCFHVNPHFSDLDAPASFIQSCRRRSQESSPRLILVFAADRALYATLDLLRQSLGSLSGLHFEAGKTEGEVILVNGMLGQASTFFGLQSARSGEKQIPDGSPLYFLDIKVTAVFSSGTLGLLSVAGPVIWNANLFQSVSADQPISDCLCETSPSLAAFSGSRIRANLTALERLVRQIETGYIPSNQSPEVLLEISRIWEEMSARIGHRIA